MWGTTKKTSCRMVGASFPSPLGEGPPRQAEAAAALLDAITITMPASRL